MDEMYFTDEDECKWLTVAVYLCDKAYGGSEEGGWWYTYGDLYKEIPPIVLINPTYAQVREAHDKLEKIIEDQELNPKGYRSDLSSVCCEGRYMPCAHTGELPEHFPSERPYYE